MPDVYVAGEPESEKGKHKPHKKRVVSDYSTVVRNSPRTQNPLAQFVILPKHTSMEVLDQDEELILLTRKHWITNWKWVLVVGLMILFSLGLWLLPFFEVLPLRYQIATMLLWYLVTTAIALEGFLGWYFDMFAVTDERIIDIDFKNLIYKNVTATKIDNIEDVTYSISGALASLMRYGNVLIQTAGAGMMMAPQGTKAKMEIWGTPHPGRVAKLINEMILEEEREKLEGRVR